MYQYLARMDKLIGSTSGLVREILLDPPLLRPIKQRGRKAGKRAGKAQRNQLELKKGRRRKYERTYTKGVSSTQHSRTSCSALGEKSWQSTGSGHCGAEGADGS